MREAERVSKEEAARKRDEEDRDAGINWGMGKLIVLLKSEIQAEIVKYDDMSNYINSSLFNIIELESVIIASFM